MGSVRVRNVSSSRQLDETVDDFITRGYRVVSQGENGARLKLRTWGSAGGHAIVLILFGWWTLGFFNLCYAVWARLTADEVMVRNVDDRDEDGDGDFAPRRAARGGRW